MSTPSLAERLVARLTAAEQTLCTCESLTGGGVGAAITAVPGASATYVGGLITYASALKVRLAHVDDAFVAQHGVVNERTAREMATGARRRCDADWAVSTTGVAGPTEQDGAPVGTVWVAVAGPGGLVRARRVTVPGDRAAVRAGAADAALELLWETVAGE